MYFKRNRISLVIRRDDEGYKIIEKLNMIDNFGLNN